MLNLYFNFSFFSTVHTARGTCKKKLCSGWCGCSLYWREGKKSALVSHLNHTFNLTGRHKKSAPYYTDTQTRMHIRTLTLTDTHTHAHGVRTKTTLKSYSATRCFSQIPDYNTNGAARACVCARESRFVVLTTATCTFSQRASYFTHKKCQFYKILLKHIIVDRVNIVCTTYTNAAMRKKCSRTCHRRDCHIKSWKKILL